MTLTKSPDMSRVESTTSETSRSRCSHCGGNLILESHDEDFGKQPTLFTLSCLQCGRMDRGRYGFRSRRWHLDQGIPAETLDEVARGKRQFVWAA